MTDDALKCSKCGYAAARGFLADYSDGTHFLAKWIEGETVNRTLLGITGDISGWRQFSVRSLRCERCGFLELYAVYKHCLN